MAYKPLENLKGHVVSRPPVVIFIGCMFLFAISVIVCGYYFKYNEVPNYEMSEDWNMFFSDFSDIDFCLAANESLHLSVADTTPNPFQVENTTVSEATDPFPQNDYDDDWSTRRNLSVSVLLLIDPSVYSVKAVTNLTLMSSVVPAAMLGKPDSEEMISVQFEVPSPLKMPECDDPTVCHIVVQTCLHLVGASSIFPNTRQPASCRNASESLRHDNRTAVMTVREKGKQLSNWCTEGTVAHAKHKFDPRLTVMLSSAERSLINLHLMYTSYFMFIMVIMWVCYALLKGPPNKVRSIHNNSTEKKMQPTV